jgi:DNA helicase-2/ATP-dependent DNA helicase PcrA
LKRTQPDWESRWENVQELITFASEVEVSSVDERDFEETPTEDNFKSATHFINLKVGQKLYQQGDPSQVISSSIYVVVRGRQSE